MRVDVDALEQRPRAVRLQPVVQAAAERAEVRELAVAQREQAVVHAGERVGGARRP